MKVAVFGLGYVGTVSAACLAANGHDVWGVDPDELKVAAISAGHSPVVEPGLQPDPLHVDDQQRGLLEIAERATPHFAATRPRHQRPRMGCGFGRHGEPLD